VKIFSHRNQFIPFVLGTAIVFSLFGTTGTNTAENISDQLSPQ
jgi:hypothetical protein